MVHQAVLNLELEVPVWEDSGLTETRSLAPTFRVHEKEITQERARIHEVTLWCKEVKLMVNQVLLTDHSVHSWTPCHYNWYEDWEENSQYPNAPKYDHELVMNYWVIGAQAASKEWTKD